MLKIGDDVTIKGKEGPDRKGIVVPRPEDYNALRMIYVHFYDTQETVLIPESRVEAVYPSCCKNGVCDCE
jgi:hypothetical protein